MSEKKVKAKVGRKRRKKFEPPSPPVKAKKPVMPDHCLVMGCQTKPTRIIMRGFCTGHFHQIKRGLLTEDGKPTGKALKVIARQALKTWAVEKEVIATKMTESKLKVLQSTHPETTKTNWCKPLGFWTCEAVCFSRMFLRSPVPDECVKCHQNDARLPFLKEFLEKEEPSGIAPVVAVSTP